MINFGSYVRERRIQLGYLLNFFCDKYSYNSNFLNLIENNRVCPPEWMRIPLAFALKIGLSSHEYVRYNNLFTLAQMINTIDYTDYKMVNTPCIRSS